MPEQRRGRVKRFAGEHVQRRTAYPAIAEHTKQRVFID